MRRIAALALIVGLAGCSNAPLAGLLDCTSPRRNGSDPPRNPDPVVPDVRPRDPGPGGKVEPLPPPADASPFK